MTRRVAIGVSLSAVKSVRGEDPAWARMTSSFGSTGLSALASRLTSWPALTSREGFRDSSSRKAHEVWANSLRSFARRVAVQESTPASLSRLLENVNVISVGGGYSNIVAADTLRRASMLAAASMLVRGERFQTVTNSIRLSCPRPKDIMRLMGEACMREKRMERFEQLRVHLAKTGPISSEPMSTSFLLNGFHLEPLAVRMLETCLCGTLSLPALVSFLSRGGTVDTIKRGDAGRYEKVMGEALADFQDEELGIGVVLPEHIRVLLPDSPTEFGILASTCD